MVSEEPMREPLTPKHNYVFVFEGGSLEVKGEGNTNIGDGILGFSESDAEYEPYEDREGCYIFSRLPKSEMVALRDFLNVQFPPAQRGADDTARLAEIRARNDQADVWRQSWIGDEGDESDPRFLLRLLDTPSARAKPDAGDLERARELFRPVGAGDGDTFVPIMLIRLRHTGAR